MGGYEFKIDLESVVLTTKRAGAQPATDAAVVALAVRAQQATSHKAGAGATH